MTEGTRLSRLEYSVESVGMAGESESGDLHVVRETSTGILLGVVDGLGHGVEAATAAQLAVRTIEAHAEEPIITIAGYCDEKLRMTRGAVMALASINTADNTLTWLSIGNVEGILIRLDPRANPHYETIFMRSGVVGYRLPLLSAFVCTISEGDLLILATDGIRTDFSQHIASDVRYADDVLNRLTVTQIVNLSRGEPVEKPTTAAHEYALAHNIDLSFVKGGRESYAPHRLAQYVSRNYLKGSDDALVLVGRYCGAE